MQYKLSTNVTKPTNTAIQTVYSRKNAALQYKHDKSDKNKHRDALSKNIISRCIFNRNSATPNNLGIF